MAQTILLKRRTSDATAPSASDLTTGEVAVNAYSGKLYIKKSDGTVAEVSGSGGGGSSFPAVYNTYKYTATNGQTTFSGNDASSNLLTYNVGNLIVYLNGVLLVPTTDYVATTGNTVVLQDGATTNDILTIIAFTATIGDGNVAVDTFSGDGSTTAFTLAANPQNENNTQVFIDGIYQSKSNYAVSGTTLTFSTAPPNNTSIEVTTGSREVTQYTATTLSLPNAGMSITGGDLDIPSDSRKIKLGASNDLQIFHDGTNNYIQGGTGDLRIDAKSGERGIVVTPDGATTLYYDNAAKLATVTGGVTITGTATATTFVGNVTGNVSGSSGSTTGNAATATALANARTIGGTSFDGTANIAVNLAATATALANARTIGGTSFDGTANIVPATAVSVTGAAQSAITSVGTLTGLTSTGYVGILQSGSTVSHPLHLTKEIAGYQAYFNNDNGSAQGVKVRIKSNDSGDFNMLELVSASTGSDVTAMVVRDDGKVGIGETTPLGQLHVKTADSGASADGSADELVVEGSANSGMSILSGTTSSGSIYFGDSVRNWDGYIAYAHGTSPTMTIASNGGGNYIKLDDTGHVGFSTTPTAWDSGYKSIQIGARGFVAAHTGSDLYLGQNAYIDSSWKYEASVAASLTQHSGGQITHSVAAAGTAGNAISWTTAMHIDTGGRVGIKATTEADGTAMTSPLTISGVNDGGNIFEAHRTGNSIHRQYMSTGGLSYFDIYGTAPQLKFRIAGADIAQITTSGLKMENGKGIDFSATGGTSASGASTASHLLDDYEEGTWTPGISTTGNSFDSGTTSGRYIKIGKQVIATMFLNNSSNNSFGSGQLIITGLPYTCNSNNAQSTPTPVMTRYINPPSGAFHLTTYVGGGESQVYFYWSTTGNWAVATGNDLASGSAFAFYASAIYEVA